MDDICCCAVDGNLFYCVCQDEAGWERSEDWVWDLRETQNNMENMRNKWHKIVDKVVPGHIRSGTFFIGYMMRITVFSACE